MEISSKFRSDRFDLNPDIRSLLYNLHIGDEVSCTDSCIYARARAYALHVFHAVIPFF